MRGMAETIHVLHVDDEPDFAELAATFLERADDRIVVHTADSAAGGLDTIAVSDVDCVVSDYDMPGENGIEFLETVREDRPALPFVLFTGKGSEEVASEAVSAGVTDYLQKETGTDQYTVLANRIRNAVDRYRAEQARDRQREAIETAREGISILNEDGEFIYVNHRYAELYGYEPAEMLGEHWELIYPGDELSIARDEILPTVAEEGYWHGETTGLRADGTTFPEDHVVSQTANGELVCTVRDLSDRREREAELRMKTRAMDEAPIGITITDPSRADNPIIYVNDRFEELTGYGEEILGLNCRVLQGKETASGPVTTMRDAIDAEEPTTVELRNYRKDGTEFWNRLSIAPVYDESGSLANYVGFQQDITDRRDVRQELEGTNALLSTLIETLPVGVLAEDGSRNVLAVNERLFELFEMPGAPGDVIGADCEEMAEAVSDMFVDPERFVEGVDERIADHEPATDEALNLTDGRTFERSYRPIDLSDGDGHLWMYRDVTDWVKREQERKTTIEFLQRLYDVATDMTLNANEKITRLLELGPEELGLPSGYLTRIEVSDGTPRTGTQRVIEASGDHELLQPGNSSPLSESYCRKTIRADGVVVIPDALAAGWAEDPAYELFGLGCYIGTAITVNDELYGTVFFASEAPREEPFTDTERTFVRLMSQLVSYELERDHARQELEQRNERFEEFANVVSHDLRSPLSVVEGRLELAQGDCDSEHLQAMETAVGRMNRIIDGVLQLAREGRDIGTVEPVAIRESVEAAWSIVADNTDGAALQYEGDGIVDATIEADEDRFHQLLENLLRNAVEHGSTGSRTGSDDAVEHGTSDVTVTVGTVDDGFYVEDDGPGIPEASRDDVFAAGYSTDEDGTGFGLSIVKQVIDAHGWEIRVTDGTDGGARFEITGVEFVE